MARKTINVVENTSIDKIETFLQAYFKHLIFGIGAVIVLFVAGYIGYSLYKSSNVAKMNIVGESEISLNKKDGIEHFESLKAKASFLKEYISLKTAEAKTVRGQNEAALKSLLIDTGKFNEISSGLAFDLGANINAGQYVKNGNMKPVWYYRLVLSSKGDERKKNLELFRSAYPESRLLSLLENWDN